MSVQGRVCIGCVLLRNGVHDIDDKSSSTTNLFCRYTRISLYLKTKKLLSVFPLFMTNMLSFLRTRLPTISCLYVNHITSNA